MALAANYPNESELEATTARNFIEHMKEEYPG